MPRARTSGRTPATRTVPIVETTPLNDVDLGGQIARDLKANGLLTHLRCVPDFHVFSLFGASACCADLYHIVIPHLKRQSRSRLILPNTSVLPSLTPRYLLSSATRLKLGSVCTAASMSGVLLRARLEFGAVGPWLAASATRHLLSIIDSKCVRRSGVRRGV